MSTQDAPPAASPSPTQAASPPTPSPTPSPTITAGFEQIGTSATVVGDLSVVAFRSDTADPEQLELMAKYVADQSLTFHRGNGKWLASFECASTKQHLATAEWSVTGLETKITEFKVDPDAACPDS
jgi:hypothetical protein